MNKKFFVIALSALALSGCNSFNFDPIEEDNGTHTHTFSDKWSYDGKYHWHQATCEHSNEQSDYELHSFAVVPGDVVEQCTVCGYRRRPNQEYRAPQDYYTKIQESYAICNNIERNGSILLKNNGVLPLGDSAKKITLFGMGSKELFMRSSAMGPAKNPGDCLSLYQAFMNRGIEVNKTVLDAIDVPQENSIYKGDSQDFTRSINSTMLQSFAEYSDAAIITITRGSADNVDVSSGSLELSDNEKKLLKAVKDSREFDKIIVLLNLANTMSMDWVDNSQYGIDAILYIGAPGYYATEAIVDVLLGFKKDETKVSPSGRAPDTFTYSAESSPAFPNYGDSQVVVYKEGIYVGYKYYETRYEDCVYGRNNANSSAGVFNTNGGNSWNYNNEVVYPFGYGLSYAKISSKLISVEQNSEDMLCFRVEVKNSSDYSTYVPVQIYAKQPYTDYDVSNDIEKPAIMLAGYDSINVGPYETLYTQINVPKYLLATYDKSRNGRYVVEQGDYWFALGDNAHDALNEILKNKDELSNLTNIDGSAFESNGLNVIQLPFSEIVYSKSPYNKDVSISNKFDDADYNYNANLNEFPEIVNLTRQDWKNSWPETTNVSPVNSTKKDMRQYAPQSDEDGNTQQSFDASGKPAVLEDMQFVSAKGNASGGKFSGMSGEGIWQNFVEQMSINELAQIVSDAYGIGSIRSIKKPANKVVEGIQGIAMRFSYGDNRWATCFPGAQIVAATFSKTLQYNLGRMIADEALLCNTVIVNGPNLSIARTPYGGNSVNFFSEDAILNYNIGSEIIGAARERGVILCTSGCCLNNQQTGQQRLETYCSEQAIREIYLRAFEGAVTCGGALGIQTSYNRIGAVYNAANSVLMEDIIRGEWGFDGFFSNAPLNGSNADAYSNGPAMLASGTDLFSIDYGRGEQLINASVALTSSLQRAAKKILYALSKSALYSLGDVEYVGVKNDYIYSNNNRPSLDVPIVKEQSSYDFDSTLLSLISGDDEVRSGHQIVFEFEGSYSECYNFDYSQKIGKLNLWDDGIFSGKIDNNTIKGYWYSSSKTNNKGTSDCLVLLTKNGYNQAFDIGGFYSKGIVCDLGMSWGNRWMLLTGARYSPTMDIKIYPNPLGNFRVGGNCYDEDFPVYRVTDNGSYFPILDKTSLTYTYGANPGVLSGKKYVDEGEITANASWKNFVASNHMLIFK